MMDDWERSVPRMSDWEALAKQKASLEEQEEEAMAKILRLRKQRKFLLRRETEMSKRGLKFLDELDAAEAKEKGESEARDQLSLGASSSGVAVLASAFSSSPLDPTLGQALADFDPADPFWAAIGFGVESPPCVVAPGASGASGASGGTQPPDPSN
jgi:hypothetical protein